MLLSNSARRLRQTTTFWVFVLALAALLWLIADPVEPVALAAGGAVGAPDGFGWD